MSTSGGSSGGGGGGLPYQHGAGNPTGSVVPTQPGVVYVDDTGGGLYVSDAPVGVDSWVALGGPTSLQVAGISGNTTEVALTLGASGALQIDDVLANVGTGNGIVFQANGTDGDQTLTIQLGSTGQFIWVFDAAGNLITPPLPAADPHIVGALYTVTGVVHVSTG